MRRPTGLQDGAAEGACDVTTLLVQRWDFLGLIGETGALEASIWLPHPPPDARTEWSGSAVVGRCAGEDEKASE